MGSSVGHISMDIARANPGVSIVLQDFANVLEQAQSFFHENAPDVLENDRVRFVPFDFLKDSPVAGCDYYYVSKVTSFRLLRHCNDASVAQTYHVRFYIPISMPMKRT